MPIRDTSPEEFAAAEARAVAAVPTVGRVIHAFYDLAQKRIVLQFESGAEFAFPPDMAQGLGGANDHELEQIEIVSAGLGLHWPQLDADLYVPSLLAGRFGSRKWMEKRFGSASAPSEWIRPTDEEEAEINRGIAEDPDNPEWTDEDFARARPASEVVPEIVEDYKRRMRKR